jgi:hypothetical protein
LVTLVNGYYWFVVICYLDFSTGAKEFEVLKIIGPAAVSDFNKFDCEQLLNTTFED